MTKLLLLIAVGIIAYLVLRRFAKNNNNDRTAQPPAYAPMVSCMSCGLHLSRDAAIERSGRFYCCAEHADQNR